MARGAGTRGELGRDFWRRFSVSVPRGRDSGREGCGGSQTNAFLAMCRPLDNVGLTPVATTVGASASPRRADTRNRLHVANTITLDRRASNAYVLCAAHNSVASMGKSLRQPGEEVEKSRGSWITNNIVYIVTCQIETARESSLITSSWHPPGLAPEPTHCCVARVSVVIHLLMQQAKTGQTCHVMAGEPLQTFQEAE
mmetsp:Transcript_31422/g.97220  ORF Transcript_31422/g.97220 Transcript_31422/m.97220 type:complete len:198 (-) Transcript_31422:919-1512(-)